MARSRHRRRDRPTVLLAVDSDIARGFAAQAPPSARWELLPCEPRALEFVATRAEHLGLVGAVLQDTDGDRARVLTRAGVAVVLVDQPPQPGVATVASDGPAIGELAYRVLRARGFTRFGFWGVPGYWTSDRREAGFDAAIARDGRHRHPGGRPGLPTFGEVMKAAIAWLRAAPKPMAVFTDSALRAGEMMWAARLAGLRVPEQIAILGGTEDAWRCTFNTPTLSAIDTDLAAIGAAAAGALADLLAGRRPARRGIAVPPGPVRERVSTEIVIDAPPAVAAALRLIRARAADGIGVAAVAAAVGVARRTLELAFRTALDRSIGEALALARVAVARDLLETTRLGLPDICVRCGVSYPSSLSRLFARHVGMPPRDYRRRYGIDARDGT